MRPSPYFTGGVGFLAKDPWHPAIRREQMIATELVARHVPVRFVQSPADWRRVRTDPANWARHLTRGHYQAAAPQVLVTERSTVVAGSRGRLAERLDAALLGTFLRRSAWDPALTVAMLPWEWRAVRRLRGRRVFDCTDDWAAVLPSARGLPDQLRRIADEADEVIVVNAVLGRLFPGRTPVVVPNGTDAALLAAPHSAQRAERQAVYVGSIAGRFDVDLVRTVLGLLPDWTLTVYGQLVFPLREQQQRQRFLALGDEFPGRFRYAGMLPRTQVAEVLDNATVGLIPDVPDRAIGQSPMKAYDYCARGVPVIATAGHLEYSSDVPPHTYVVTGAAEMAAAMQTAAGEPAGCAADRIAWATARTWDLRTDDWLRAAMGEPVSATAVPVTAAAQSTG